MKSAEFRFTEPLLDCDNENALSGLLLRAIQALNDRDRRGVNHILERVAPGERRRRRDDPPTGVSRC